MNMHNFHNFHNLYFIFGLLFLIANTTDATVTSLESTFDFIDVNHDRLISASEFQEYLYGSFPLNLSEAEMSDTFGSIDVNHDKKLSHDELKMWYIQFKKSTVSVLADMLLSMTDRNRDGLVSLTEVREALTTYSGGSIAPTESEVSIMFTSCDFHPTDLLTRDEYKILIDSSML